jgi:hypothetical protein
MSAHQYIRSNRAISLRSKIELKNSGVKQLGQAQYWFHLRGCSAHETIHAHSDLCASLTARLCSSCIPSPMQALWRSAIILPNICMLVCRTGSLCSLHRPVSGASKETISGNNLQCVMWFSEQRSLDALLRRKL